MNLWRVAIQHHELDRPALTLETGIHSRVVLWANIDSTSYSGPQAVETGVDRTGIGEDIVTLQDLGEHTRRSAEQKS
jgi:hypothetical protein